MDKVTLHIQSKEFIENLIKEDPEFRIAIKDAIVDSIIRRHIKFIENRDVERAVKKAVENDLKDKYFSIVARYVKQLTDEINNAVDREVDNTIKGITDSHLAEFKKYVNDKIDIIKLNFEASLQQKLNSLDIPKTIQEEIKKVLAASFKAI